MRQIALLFAVSILAAGCGDDKSSGGGGGGGGSPTGPVCLYAGDSCYVASGVTVPADVTSLGAACTGGIPAGTFTASGTCSTASTVTGYCQYPDTSLSGVTVTGATLRGYFYTSSYDATSAGVECAGGGGTWTGGSGGGGTTTTLRCLFAGDMCDEVTGTMTATDITNLSTACSSGGGTPSQAACSTAGTVSGHCHYSNTSMTGVTIAGGYIDEYFYTAGGWILADAQSYCASPPAGTWVP